MKKIKAFTMLEILMITLIIGIGLLSIVVAVSKAKQITNKTKQEVIATQLAKEGIEMVYQRRNTNLIRYHDAKKFCRLNIHSDSVCDTDDAHDIPRITEGNYIINSIKNLSGINTELNIGDGVNTGEYAFSICLTGNKRESCPYENNQTKYGKFFRVIEGIGLYTKNHDLTGGLKITCLNGEGGGSVGSFDYSCARGTEYVHPMEFRFCSRVEYIGTHTGSVEICGALTNFFD